MPLRVLVVSHLYPSKERPHRAPWLAEQVAALSRRGVDVEVLCCSPFDRSYDGTAGDGAVPVRYRSTSAGMLNDTRAGLVVSTLRYAWEASRFLGRRRGSYDLVHAHFAFPDGLIACVLGRHLRIPVVVTLHGSDVARVLARRSILSALLGTELASARRVICVSAELEQAARTGLPAHARTTLIPNGFDDALFRSDERERDLGFLFVGGLRTVKNVELLLDVYLTCAELHAWPLTLVGSGPLESVLRARIGSLPGSARVELTGPVSRSQAAELMQRAGALVLPSEREGYGVVAAEALACGTPVVASRVGGLPHILAGPAAGVLVEPGDRDALADAMRSMLSWPYDAAAVAGASGAAPWSYRAEEILDVYLTVIQEESA